MIGAHGWGIPRGVGGRCLLLSIRVLAAARQPSGGVVGIGDLTNIDAGMKVCVDLGADVINMSFGTAAADIDPHGPLPHAAIVRYASAANCVLVAASGNTGRKEVFYPAALPEVIAVGSVGAGGERSPFSTYGDHIALCAPGERIVSAGRDGYEEASGTSFAAPFVSGAAALLVSRARRADRRSPPEK